MKKHLHSVAQAPRPTYLVESFMQVDIVRRYGVLLSNKTSGDNYRELCLLDTVANTLSFFRHFICDSCHNYTRIPFPTIHQIPHYVQRSNMRDPIA